jgi:hypothetical protein
MDERSAIYGLIILGFGLVNVILGIANADLTWIVIGGIIGLLGLVVWAVGLWL